MKLVLDFFKDLFRDDFQVLLSLEKESRDGHFVSIEQIRQKSGVGNVGRSIERLAEARLIKREKDLPTIGGFQLSYNGHDYLAINSFVSKGVISSFGASIGVGKESDIYSVLGCEGTEMVAKIHRLGRPSFRSVKNKRDYQDPKLRSTWNLLSRLSAEKEYTFMVQLYSHRFPVPKPIAHNRHIVIMEKIEGMPLYKIRDIVNDDIPSIHRRLVDLIVQFAQYGLVHGDLNEFNILMDTNGKITVIDFPQIISFSHPNAKEIFNRDIKCIHLWFQKKYGYEGCGYPVFDDIVVVKERLDVLTKAPGFKKP